MTLALSAALAALWLVLAGLFAGNGALLLGLGELLDDGWRSVHAAFWSGVAVVTGILLAWHLLFPVNGIVLAALALTGLFGCLRHRSLLVAGLRSAGRWPLAAVVAIGALWVANHALNLGAYDDYNYEFQAVRWNHDFAIVPGLANLHGRLGFNESHHLLAAMLSVGPLAGRVNHVLNGLFVTVVLSYLGTSLNALWRRGRAGGESMAFGALLLPPVVGLVLFGEVGPMISTLKADVIVTCSVFAAACLWLEFAEAAPGSRAYERAGATVLLVCAFALSVKLSAAVFSVALAAGVCGRALADARGAIWRVPAGIRVAGGIALVIGVLVPLRGVILSGYPAYPVTAAGLPVDWRVAASQGELDRAIITSMGRGIVSYDPRGLDPAVWLPAWAHHIALDAKFTVLLPALLAALGVAGAYAAGPRQTPPTATRWAKAVLIAASAGALAVWWLEAPAPRFGSQHLWILAACAILAAADGPRWRWKSVSAAAATAAVALAILLVAAPIAPPDRPQIIVLFVGAFVWLVVLGTARVGSGAAMSMMAIALTLAEPSGRMIAALVRHRVGDAADIVWLVPDHYYTSGVTIYPVVARQTRSGLTVYIPAATHYETPLPNSRYFNPHLELRTPGTMAAGFRARLPSDEAGPGYSLDFFANRGAAERDAHARR